MLCLMFLLYFLLWYTGFTITASIDQHLQQPFKIFLKADLKSGLNIV